MRRPLIAIGCDIAPISATERRERVYIWSPYLDAIARAGGTPLLVPFQAADLESIVESVDGLVLAGGDDVAPDTYGEQNVACGELLDSRRQAVDLALARLARERSIPILGICLGSQILNVAAGGTLVQDIPSQVPGALEHRGNTGNRKRHVVEVARGSRLAAILGETSVNVNSGHHQAVRDVGHGLSVVAKSSDGIVEAIEDPLLPFHVGVQWHPEEMLEEVSADRLFAALVEAAGSRAERRCP
jgi:putative glutamine amidotransferase